MKTIIFVITITLFIHAATKVNAATFFNSAEKDCYRITLDWKTGALAFDKHTQNFVSFQNGQGFCFDTAIFNLFYILPEIHMEKPNIVDSTIKEDQLKDNEGEQQKTAAWMLLIGLIQKQFQK